MCNHLKSRKFRNMQNLKSRKFRDVQKLKSRKFKFVQNLKSRTIFFSLPGCSVKFTAKSSLYVHMKKHDSSGEKITYHCPMEGCEKKYSNKVTLRQHLVKQHLSNTNGTADLAQNIDILPILLGDMQDIEQSGSKVTAATPSTTGKKVCYYQLGFEGDECVSNFCFLVLIYKRFTQNSQADQHIGTLTNSGADNVKKYLVCLEFLEFY